MKVNRLASAIALTFVAFSASSAQYRVVELPFLEKGANNFASSINEKGEVVTTVQTFYRPPIDRSLIDFDNEKLKNILEDIDAAEDGDFTTNDYTLLYSTIKSGAGNLFRQQIADLQSYISDGIDPAELVTAFDQIDPDTKSYTMSANTRVRQSHHGFWVGSSSAPYYKLEYTNADGKDLTYVLNDFETRGFVQRGNFVAGLVPPEKTLGGISEAYDINANMQVVGYATTEAMESVEDAEKNCQDKNKRGDQPEQACLKSLRATGVLQSSFKRRGVIWQLDNQGNVIDTRTLGLLSEPDTQENYRYNSLAVAINDAGVAVGQSTDTSNVKGFATTHAAIFTEDEVIGFVNKIEYLSSQATGINNNNKVIGQATKTINGSSRSKFFVHNLDSGETLFPNDFFPGSSSFANDINDNNIVVGEGEVETDINNTRRRNGFVYDLNQNQFTNINLMLACNTPYTIVEAVSINNDGEIAANALVHQVTRHIDGSEILDDAGNPVTADKVVAVKLTPIPGGQIDDCHSNKDLYKREGASSSLYGLGLLMLAGLFRRFRNAGSTN